MAYHIKKLMFVLLAIYVHGVLGRPVPAGDTDNEPQAEVLMMTMDMGTGTGMPEMPGMPEMDMPHMMPMFFHLSDHAQILFEDWQTTNWKQMMGSCIGVAILAACYEGFKIAREILFNDKQRPGSQRKGNKMNSSGVTNLGYNGNSNQNNNYGMEDGDDRVDDGCCNPKVAMCNGWHWFQSILHVIQIFLSYSLMLVFMTYNGWLCIAVCVGAGLGHLLFGWMRQAHFKDTSEHCH